MLPARPHAPPAPIAPAPRAPGPCRRAAPYAASLVYLAGFLVNSGGDKLAPGGRRADVNWRKTEVLPDEGVESWVEWIELVQASHATARL